MNLEIPGWESRVDVHGRIFYIDHVNRKTTWQKPSASSDAVQTLSPNGLTEQREQFERRYQSIRRTVSRARTHDDRPPQLQGWQRRPVVLRPRFSTWRTCPRPGTF